MELGVFEARNRFSERIDAAERGEETIVLRHNRPVARIIPIALSAKDIVADRLEALRMADVVGDEIVRRNGRPFTHDELMQARDEGKR